MLAIKLPGPLLVLGRASNILGAVVSSSTTKRTIVSKTYFKEPANYKEPWPYKEKGYTRFNWPQDFTKNRLHENSKLIVVEGNIGAGKSTVAAEIADQLGFLHMPEFRMDEILIDRYGNDLRKYYHLFPKAFRIPDVNMFYENPMDDNTARMQFRLFECRFEQYMNAVAHIFNTGQGVVLERGFHTDFVFANAMRVKDYISPEFHKFYMYCRKRAIPILRYWPHLVIHLDASIGKCMERIKERGNVSEIKTADVEYLTAIDQSYRDALREFKRHSKLLIYDWDVPGHADQIVEDIERLDLDFFEWHSSDVHEEWHTPSDEVWYSHYRAEFTQKWPLLFRMFNDLRTHEVGELYVDIQDLGHFLNTMKTQVLGSRYGYGYYPEKGDDKKAAMMAWKYGQNLPEPWFEYYWKDTYIHQIHSFETYADPTARSYNPDYLHHH
ncbi:NADH dehydrogenase [ubiquinone] 1 alpha subcomplex subunit 10, mitochondrial [Aphelenchoides besseyi]|nr:NADH dehydrogenase [ubiquinone] 1 alpha subcomplex subunit 10, mitochondrial [Aphelenchoides besseyi]KAI6210113.1 NADH dehydrogenase [ubiquinone] 1 alpha subcomplex subunit 10, mitochondrial [Aphelenchoides besseyi]